MQQLPARLLLWLLWRPDQRMHLLSLRIARYQKRISSLQLDRIDIHIKVPCVDYVKLADKRQMENSTIVRVWVQAVHERQLQRFAGTKLTCHTEMGPSEVRDFCTVELGAEKLLKAAMQQLHLSARAFHLVLKLADDS